MHTRFVAILSLSVCLPAFAGLPGISGECCESSVGRDGSPSRPRAPHGGGFGEAALPWAQIPGTLAFAAETPAGPSTSLPPDTRTPLPADSSADNHASSDKAHPDEWNQFRGPRGDGHVAWLPQRLPATPTALWSTRLTAPGVGGVAATDAAVIVSDRTQDDTMDCWRALDPTTGQEQWAYRYQTTGKLGYGNSARATPLIHGGRVFTLSAFGQLHCLDLKRGELLWKLDLATAFGPVKKSPWGYASSPVLIDGRLIVAPGARDASVVALEPATGAVLWHTAGGPTAYGSYVQARVNGATQLIGYDRESLGGFDPATGRRLWTHQPAMPGDFNVPTPLQLPDGRLILSTENNGTRLHAFDAAGLLQATPLGQNEECGPDTNSPVFSAGRVFSVCASLYCLDPQRQLAATWTGKDPAFAEHVSMLASDDRLLVASRAGELLLVDAAAPQFTVLSRLSVFPDEKAMYAHPAILGKRLFLRSSTNIICLQL